MFGSQLINLSQVYEIDFKETDDGVLVDFFYHLAGSTSGGHLSEKFETMNDAVCALTSVGIEIKTVIPAEGYYDASRF